MDAVSFGATKGRCILEMKTVRVPYTKHEILEHDREYAVLFLAMRDLRRRHDAMLRRGDGQRAEAIVRELQLLRDPILYQHRIWTERGRWNRFYTVQNGGLTHTRMMCRTINASTVAVLDWQQSGQDRAVVNACRRLCRHCGSWDTAEITEVMMHDFWVAHYLIDP
jgi:hypothetical protein